MPYSFTLTTTIPASPQEVYEAWLDSLAHSEMTGGPATMSGEVGAEVSAWDNYITGRNIELVPGERIVQSWRTSEFENEHEDSIITLTLEGVEEGTLLTLEHTNVPDEQRSYEDGGWQENYFEPMVAYFSERRLVATEPEEEEAAPAAAEAPLEEPAVKPRRRSRPKPLAAEPEPETKAPPKKKVAPKKRAAAKKKSAPKRAAKSARKAKRAAKAKRVAPRAKMPVKKRKTSRKAAGASARKRAKATRRKSARKRR